MKGLIAALAAAAVCPLLAGNARAQEGAPADETPVESSPPPDEGAKDKGLGLEWLWVDADAGFSYANMASFNTSNFALQNTANTGTVVALGAGVRLLFLSAGLRARDLPLSDFNLVELDGEVAFHGRMGRGDMYFGGRGGYAFSGSFSANTVTSAAAQGGQPSEVRVHGGNAGLILGYDYYFNHFFSLGFDANPEVLFLQRPAATPPAPPQISALPPAQQQMAQMAYMQYVNSSPYKQLYNQSGSSVGFAFLGTLHAALHF